MFRKLTLSVAIAAAAALAGASDASARGFSGGGRAFSGSFHAQTHSRPVAHFPHHPGRGFRSVRRFGFHRAGHHRPVHLFRHAHAYRRHPLPGIRHVQAFHRNAVVVRRPMPSISRVILAHLRFHPPGRQHWPRPDGGDVRWWGSAYLYHDFLPKPGYPGGCAGINCPNSPSLLYYGPLLYPSGYRPPGTYGDNGGGCVGNVQCGVPSGGTNNPPSGKPIDGGSAGVPASN